MRPIALDYRPRRHRLGKALLGAGLLLGAGASMGWLSVAGEAERWAGVADAAPRRPGAATITVDAAQLEEMEQANAVIHGLSLPWDGLFSGIEEAATERVALLGVAPDPTRRVVVISGEAPAYAEVLRYMTRLDAGAVLTEPRLLNHEVREEGSRHPVAFAITTRWRMQQ